MPISAKSSLFPFRSAEPHQGIREPISRSSASALPFPKAHQQGELDYARELGYQTFEAAKVILNALQSTSSNKEKAIQEDVLAFGTMGMYLSSLLAQEQKKREAHAILQECQQQLIAILPLHATSPSICRLIASLQQTLEHIHLPECTNRLASETLH